MSLKKIYFLVLLFVNFNVVVAQQYEKQLLYQGFDNVAPSDWYSASFYGSKTWEIAQQIAQPFSSINPLSSSSALVKWDFAPQNEWLFSPFIPIDTPRSLTLSFYLGYNSYFLENDTLNIYYRNSKTTSWEQADLVWSTAEIDDRKNSWKWQYIEIDSLNIAVDSLQLAWQYIGVSGDLVAIDDVKIIDGIEDTRTDITAFNIQNQVGETLIDNEKKEIHIETKLGNPISGIVPSIVHNGGNSIPTVGSEQNFIAGEEFIYTITATNPEYKQDWSVFIDYYDYGTEILSFEIQNQTSEAVINPDLHTVKVEVEYKTDFTLIKPNIVVSDGAVWSPKNNEVFEVGVPKAFVVTPKNSEYDEQIWLVTVTEQKVKDGTDILSYTIENQIGETVIDKDEQSIFVKVNCDKDLENLKAAISLTDEAVAQPSIDMPHSYIENEPFVFEVSASNPDIDPVKWKVYIDKKNNTANIIDIKFNFTPKDVFIDEGNKEVFVVVDFSTDITQASPTYFLSDCASGKAVNDIGYSYEAPFYYEVSPADPLEDAVIWKLFFSKAVLIERFDDAIFPPKGWTTDTLNESKTWTVNALNALPFSNVVEASTHSAVCPWDGSTQNELLTSPFIQSSNLSNLTLQFHAAYNSSISESMMVLWLKDAEANNIKLWESTNNSQAAELKWHFVEVDLSTYINKNFQLAWQYIGQNGETMAIDGVVLSEKTATDIKQEEAAIFVVSPNPCTHTVVVNSFFNTPFKIFDAMGGLVEYGQIHTGSNLINLSHLKKGLYIIQYIYNEGVRVRKLIKQ